MARRGPKNNDQATPATDPTTEENTVTTATEAPAETPTEAPAADPATEAPAEAPAEAAAPVDLTAFLAAVDAAVAQRDESTGELPVAAFEPVTAEYRKLDGLKAKNAAKATVAERMKDAMNALDMPTARAHMLINTNALVAQSAKGGGEKPPADPKVAFTERLQAILLAYRLVASEAPEGVDVATIQAGDDLVTQAQALAAYNANEAEDKGEAPESSAVVRAALKLATGKATGGRKAGVGTGSNGGVRRDIGAHIESAFADVEAGTFLTVAEIRVHKSAEYGDEPPSAGAISARLFPASGNSTVKGVTPGTNDKGTRGATKLAPAS